MATNTTNYQLIKPAGSEKYNISIFNDNWDIIDGKIKLNADNILKKQNTITGAATTVVSSNLTANRVIISNASGKFAVSAVTATELGYLSGAKSKIQTQIDNEVTARTSAVSTLQTNVDKKVSKAGDTMTGDLSLTGTASRWIRIKRTDLDRSVEQTFPTSGTTYIGGFGLFDKTDNAMMSVNRSVTSNGVITTFQNSQFVNGAQRNSNINLIISSTGETYATTNTVTNPASNNTSIATTAWVNTASSVVHTAGNETIAGAKTFTNNPIIKGTWPSIAMKDEDYVKGSLPSSDHKVAWLKPVDSNDAELGGYELIGDTKGNVYNRLKSQTLKSDGTEVKAFLYLYANRDGTSYATAPATRSTGYGTTDIVTAGWADAKYVDVAGDTMKGKLIVNNESYIKLELKNPSADLTTGEQAYNNSIIFIDKNNKQMGQLKNDATVTNSVPQSTMSMSAKSLDSNNNVIWSTITCVAMTNGTVYAIAPNPSSKSDNSARIATTQWVNSASTVVHTSGNETIAGTKTFSNNMFVSGSTTRDIALVNTSITRGTIPSESTAIGRLRFVADANATLGEVYSTLDNQGNSFIRMVAVNNNASRADINLELGWTTSGKPYATAPATRATGYGSTDIVTAGWADAKYVGLTGVQTVSGAKTFTSNITKKQNNITKGSPSSSTIDAYYNFADSASDYIGGLRYTVDKADDSGVSYTFVGLQNNFYRDSYVRLYDNGTDAFMICPTPSNAKENSRHVATTAWVNSASTVVHTTGNETIAGNKTFIGSRMFFKTNGPIFYVDNTELDSKSSTLPTTQTANAIVFRDKNEQWCGYVQLIAGTDGRTTLALNSSNHRSGSTINSQLNIITLANGTTFATAPATRSTDYGTTDIATAGWVDSKLAALETKINETRNYIISDTEPTSEDGEDGDIWFVYE